MGWGRSTGSVGDRSYAARMAGRRTARCAFCGEQFTVERRSGPTPRYCSQAHRQRAYEERRRTARTDEEQSLADEVRMLRSRVSWLEHDNAELRRERDEAIDFAARLQDQLRPPHPVVARLLNAQAQPEDDAVEPPSRRRRRWNPSR